MLLLQVPDRLAPTPGSNSPTGRREPATGWWGRQNLEGESTL